MSSGDKSKPSRRRIRVPQLSVCGCIVVGLGIFAIFAVSALLAHRHWSQQAVCFHLDMLRARSPRGLEQTLRVPGAAEPHGNGPLCLYLDQNVLQWRVEETFTYTFDGDVIDFTLHGPLKQPRDGSTAPAVAELGIHRTTRMSAMRGTKYVDQNLLFDVMKHPSHYYVALHALAMDGASVVEIARDYLDKPAK